MKTMSAGARSDSQLARYVGLILALGASVGLEGWGLWLASAPASHIGAAAIAAIAGGVLSCLIGAVFLQSAIPVPRPRGGEEAAAWAHARKMEALGLLAGGVAHDFNNQLHVIRNSLEILERQNPSAEARRYLQMIRRSADRAGALARQLLASSRRGPVAPRPLDPNDLVTQVAELLRHSLGERIVIETVLERQVAGVTADAGELETALLNLAINARDAMSQVGLLTIETANVTLEASLRAYVMIAVSDTGTGMPPEVAARACEPFFTTKEPGQGTGLGLAQVAGFAREWGGHLRIASVPGKGTTVQLYLPRELKSPVGRACGPARRPQNQAGTPPDAGVRMARTLIGP